MKRNEILGEISDKALRRYSQDAHTEIQGAQFGRGKGTPEGEKTIAKREKGMAVANKRLSARDAERRAASKPRPLPKVGGGPEDSYGKNRYMGDSVEEAAKKGLYYNVNKRKAAGTSRPASSAKAPTDQAWQDAAKTAKKEGVAEGSKEKTQGIALSKAREISDKIDAIVSNGGRVGLDDPLSRQLKAIRNKIKQAKQGVAEVAGAQKCWPGHRKAGTQAGTGKNAGKRVNKCVKIGENLEEGGSDYVGDAIEGLRMAKPGLEKEDFLDELYSYIDAEMGMEAAEAAFADRDSYDDWYENYADMTENANMLKVAKDDDQQTILQNPSTGVQTQIDKKNPNAPTLTKDDATGKLKLAAPANGAGSTAPKPDLTGKDVEVATENIELAAVLRIAGLK